MKTQETKKTFGDRLGDKLEKAGKKIADAGMPKLGQKVHDLGDKMEKTHQSDKHPRRV